MPRDALPQWEIDIIITRLKRGERLEEIATRMSDVDPSWWARNGADLLRAAGLPPSPATGEAAPSPPPVDAPVVVEPAPPPAAEAPRKVKKHWKGR